MSNYRFRSLVIAASVLVSMLGQGTGVLAGTTGSLSGTLYETGTSTPVSEATVTAASPSQTVTTTTNGSGRFVFASLAPDSYAIAVQKQGYEATSLSGVNVFADQTQTLNLNTRRALREIGRVAARASSDLVRPGTTADVYSVNASTAEKVSALGGGGSLNQVYSAVASVPGVYIPSGSNGWFQTLQVRGGSYDQTGYELDGVPVNRSFDFYPAHTASALGQQEIQVYTGSGPANSESQGLAGFINQVIRTGTYPGFATFTAGIGSPAFYHNFSFEVGGATPNRTFSYYVGLAGANQDFRVIDQFNGASYNPTFGFPLALTACPAVPSANLISCYAGTTPAGLPAGPGGVVQAAAPFSSGSSTPPVPAHVSDRENVFNLHFGIPHHHDGGRDDLQLLYDVGGINQDLYFSPNDLGSSIINGSIGPLTYPTGFQYNGPVGAFLGADYQSRMSKYYLQSEPIAARLNGNLIEPTRRDAQQNDQAIVKLQYQKNFGTSAFFRLYGYTFYSDYILNGPVSASTPFTLGFPGDYELSTHTRGLSGEFVDQLGRHALSLQGSYTTATTIRDNNTQYLNGGGSGSATRNFAVAVDSTNPSNGICYNVTGGIGAPTTCEPTAPAAVRPSFLSFPNAFNGLADPTILNGTSSCGSGPCKYLVVENGPRATYNTVVPKFTVFNLSDQWKPTDRLSISGGVRYDRYEFVGGDTTGGTKPFWFNAWNQSNCVSAVAGSTPVNKVTLKNPVSGNSLAITDPCSAANVAGVVNYVPALLSNTPAHYTYEELEPRIGATYTVDNDTVLRVNYGKFTQPANAAFQQYNTLDQNLPNRLLGPLFYKFGFNTPGHQIPPQESYNLDFSLEKHFKNSDVSLKLTPFLRSTKNEQSQFYIDPAAAFVSGLAVGKERDAGVEFQINKGNFSQEGFSLQLSYTYTDSKIKYQPLPNGSSILSPINNDIKTYNGYTSFCATHSGDARCGIPTNNVGAAPCYNADGSPNATCAAVGGVAPIANPYWNAPVQGLLDINADYLPNTPVVSTVTLQANTYAVPHVAALIMNYRKGPFAITPSFQFQTGQRYGVPESNPGIDPAAGCGALTAAPAGDARYPYGAAGGAAYDAPTCAALLNAIPDTYTNAFDAVGAFRAPSQLLGNVQLSYEASKKISFALTLANVISQCFGGDREPWTGIANPKVCSYGGGGALAAFTPAGNVYNPGATFQPIVQYPYFPAFGPYNTNANGGLNSPFAAFLTMKVKL